MNLYNKTDYNDWFKLIVDIESRWAGLLGHEFLILDEIISFQSG